MEKKQLLIVSKNEELIHKVGVYVSLNYEVTVEKSIHVAYNLALTLLPDTILFDKNSFEKASDFKAIKTFKSTHFLNKTYLIVYGKQEEFKALKNRYKSVIDEYISDKNDFEKVGDIVQKAGHALKINYWYECFMGLFNLMAKPIVLLQQNNIIAMNDAFKKTFRVDSTEGLKLTDFVNVENKAKVKTSLRNFSRGKHMKAVTTTSLVVHSDKLRNARISFSKLCRNINDQFIMIIDFSGDTYTIDQRIGSHSNQVEECFKENSELAEFSFTKREKEIIGLLCKGYKTKEISDALFISPKTIEKHRSNIIKRTNSETILESVIFAINHNLVDSPFS
ncbi:LuxR C-terminal-related transcriptional regulator [Gramella sp. GC03-9]|uniref:LuxR C-terminal-related transcriptional regulator n=1 Tax=Christiangramia oceanisediminis TaxID=2920386 RepID=A0A9X2I4T0_9FLAO|nr:LuxR C-terminal-related transcriptional regulator [Gramella oceanisediminis]MCP9199855.1 LuxR C-terminal-related transcriptional regulator [Gramella oceanisediminis]